MNDVIKPLRFMTCYTVHLAHYDLAHVRGLPAGLINVQYQCVTY